MLNLCYFSRRAGGGGLLLLVLLVLLLLVVLILVLRVIVCQAPHLVLQVPYRSQVLHLLLGAHVIVVVIVLEHCVYLLAFCAFIIHPVGGFVNPQFCPAENLTFATAKDLTQISYLLGKRFN